LSVKLEISNHSPLLYTHEPGQGSKVAFLSILCADLILFSRRMRKAVGAVACSFLPLYVLKNHILLFFTTLDYTRSWYTLDMF
jgi:hypothetical protein